MRRFEKSRRYYEMYASPDVCHSLSLSLLFLFSNAIQRITLSQLKSGGKSDLHNGGRVRIISIVPKSCFPPSNQALLLLLLVLYSLFQYLSLIVSTEKGLSLPDNPAELARASRFIRSGLFSSASVFSIFH
jgi:hypothetical protein